MISNRNVPTVVIGKLDLVAKTSACLCAPHSKTVAPDTNIFSQQGIVICVFQYIMHPVLCRQCRIVIAMVPCLAYKPLHTTRFALHVILRRVMCFHGGTTPLLQLFSILWWCTTYRSAHPKPNQSWVWCFGCASVECKKTSKLEVCLGWLYSESNSFNKHLKQTSIIMNSDAPIQWLGRYDDWIGALWGSSLCHSIKYADLSSHGPADPSL